MQTEQREMPLRFRVADRLTGRNARLAIFTSGGLLALLVLMLMLFRPYIGRPLKIGSSGIVEQTRIDCPAARTALTRSFNKADTSVPDSVRVCVETGRAKAFTAGLMVLFIGLATWGGSHMPMRSRSRRSRHEASQWDQAISRAKSNVDAPDRRAG